MLYKRKGKIVLAKPTYPKIGEQFTGPNGFANTKTGEYWAVMPSLDYYERGIQRAYAPAIKNGEIK